MSLPPPDDDRLDALAKALAKQQAGQEPVSVDKVSTWPPVAKLGFEMMATMLVCGGLGWWLGDMLGWLPWSVLGGLFLGLAVGIYQAWQRMVLPSRQG